MSKFNLEMRYTNQKENTELNVEVNYESSEQQNDQSPKGKLGLVLDYFPLVVNILSVVPILLDTLSYMS